MPLLFSPLVLKVGVESDQEKLFGQENIAAEWIGSESNQGRAHLTIYDLSLDYIARLTQLFHQCVDSLPDDWQSHPILFLTPALGSKDSTASLFNSYCKVLPSLAEHREIYFYPYGRSACLLALKKIEHLFKQENASKLLIISIDTHQRLCPTSSKSYSDIQCYEEPHITACDSAALVNVEYSNVGLVINWYGKVALTRVNEPGQGVANLFYLFNKQYQSSIDAIHLPLNNTSRMANEWLGQLSEIASSLSSDLKCFFNGVRVGDLGTTIGLFNLLHTQSLYQKGELESGQSILQLDISDGLYQSAALFGWESEKSDAA